MRRCAFLSDPDRAFGSQGNNIGSDECRDVRVENAFGIIPGKSCCHFQNSNRVAVYLIRRNEANTCQF